MSKKKAEAKEELSYLDDALMKEFGNAFVTANDLISEERVIIPVSPAINMGLSQGLDLAIPEGSFVVLSGPPKYGKTLTALHIAAKAQKKEYANKKLCPHGRKVLYINAEGRLQPRDIKGIKDLNLDPEWFITMSSSEGNIIYSERFCAAIEKFAITYPGSVIIVDSFSILSTESEMTGEMGKQDRSAGNKVVSQLCRRLAQIIPVNKNIIIGITHQIANTSGYGASIVEKSANALKYAEDIKLVAKKREPITDANGKQIGQDVEWFVEFSCVGPPGSKVTSCIRYGIGIDEVQELVNMGIDYGLINQNKSWLSLDFLEQEESPKLQGAGNVRNAIADNPEWHKKLETKIREMLG